LIENEINTRGGLKKLGNDDDQDDNIEAEREVDDDDDDDDETFDYTDLISKMGTKLASYKKNESQITCHSAINLINRYFCFFEENN
jgi:hypothetical protein